MDRGPPQYTSLSPSPCSALASGCDDTQSQKQRPEPCADAGSAQDSLSLKRVAVVEDFFDIIYAMHVEMGAEPAETYAFLPREAVTRFLMNCGECQKRMHINPSTAEFKENDRPTSLDDSSVSSEDMDMAEPTWVSAERPLVPELSPPNGESVHSPQTALKEEDDDDSSESGSGHGLPSLTPPEAMVVGGVPPDGLAPYREVTENGVSAPLDFSTTTSSSSSSEDQQPVNLTDRLLPVGSPVGMSYPTDSTRKCPGKPDYGNKMFVRLFVDENLDRMVPISKQPKEKIQAIIESCSRQFPEFQERSRKRIRTYLKSCRRLKKVGFETRPTPPHLTSAMAENILAAACESETRNAAKRMRLDVYQDPEEPATVDKNGSRDPASGVPSGFSLAASAYSQSQIQDPVYTNGTNGGLNYSFHSYGAISNNLPTTGATTQTNGPTDLSMKSVAPTSSSSSSSNSHGGQGGGGGGASAQLSPPEVTA
ncbi:unnamed protein product, partial [Coregonus sp. 'balchen']